MSMFDYEIPRDPCMYKTCDHNINGKCMFGSEMRDCDLPCFEKYPVYVGDKIIYWEDPSDNYKDY